MNRTDSSTWKKWLMLSILCIAGGTIYTFPFLRFSYYEPLKDALGLSHTQLGVIQSVFGLIAGTVIGIATLDIFSRMGEGRIGLVWVINISAVVTTAAGIAAWFVFEDPEEDEKGAAAQIGSPTKVIHVEKTASAHPSVGPEFHAASQPLIRMIPPPPNF